MQSTARYLKVAPSELRLETTLKSGQSFRWTRITSPNPNSVALRGAFKDRVITLVQSASQIEFSSVFSHDYTGVDDTREFLEDYLNLKVNLGELYSHWSARDKHFCKISEQFLGLRMLRQDPFENLLSCICSSNNNISRISQMVQNLCKHYGKHIAQMDGVEYYTFPTLEALQHTSLSDELRALGFGYRAKFIAATVQQLSALPADYLQSLREKTYEEAHTELLAFMGIGLKVADCICLMSLDKHQAVPIDTHVIQIAQRDYKIKIKSSSMTKTTYDAIKNFFIDLWGPYAGWAHSVLFVADLKTFRNGTVDAWSDIEEVKQEAAVAVAVLPEADTEQKHEQSEHTIIKNEVTTNTVLQTKVEVNHTLTSSKRSIGDSGRPRKSRRLMVETGSTVVIKSEND